jgi:hypothetical protein
MQSLCLSIFSEAAKANLSDGTGKNSKSIPGAPNNITCMEVVEKEEMGWAWSHAEQIQSGGTRRAC